MAWCAAARWWGRDWRPAGGGRWPGVWRGAYVDLFSAAWRVGTGRLLAFVQECGAFALALCGARGVRVKSCEILCRRGDYCCTGKSCARDHADTVDGAGRDAQLAAGTKCRHHRVHLALCTDDGVHRARRQTLGTADARLLVNLRDDEWALRAIGGIEGQHRTLQQRGECGDRLCATGRALVELRAAGGERFSVGAAAAIAAARALGLRQQRIDVIRRGHPRARQLIRIPGVAPESGDS